MEILLRSILNKETIHYLFIGIDSAIAWVIDNKDKYDTKILNLSLGTPANNPTKADPLVRAVNKAVKAGITVVVAAGNSGPELQTILSPGNSPLAITVGAVDSRKSKSRNTYTVAPFSSRGPTKEGIVKPDIVAPGVDIRSLSNEEGYKKLSGTSMATPVVSGSLALLLNKNSNLRPHELKSEIMKTATNLNESPDNQGAGIINIGNLFDNSKSVLIPNKISRSDDVKKASLMADGLIFLLFAILVLIRII